MAENFKFTLLFIIIFSGILLLGYWTFVTLKPASVVVERQKQEELKEQNEQLAKEVADLKNQLRILKESEPVVKEPTEKPTVTTPTPTTTSSKYQSLINELQKLSDDKVYMKEKSQGSRVGTIQTFLNIYNKTSKPVDNDYGPGTKTDVMNFQKAQGITADGETGPGTYSKMIEWLRKQ